MNKFLFIPFMLMVGCNHGSSETTPVKESSVTHVIIVHQNSKKEDSDTEQDHSSEPKTTVNVYTESDGKKSEFAEKATSTISNGADWVWDKSKGIWRKVTSEESKQKVKSAFQSAKSFVSEKLEQAKEKFDN